MQIQKSTAIVELSKIHLAELVKLKQKKFRKLERKVLVEGVNLIEQLISNGVQPREIITSEPHLARQVLQETRCPILEAKPHEIAKLSDTEHPQAIVGVFPEPEFTLGKYKLILYLDGIQDPGNLGTIFRTAAAFNLDGLVLSPDSCEVFSPKVIRASLGSVFWLPAITADVTWLADQNAEKLALVQTGNVNLKDFKINKGQQVIMIIGSEAQGIRPQVMKVIDQSIAIPISDQMESLNASVAAGIALYELCGRFYG